MHNHNNINNFCHYFDTKTLYLLKISISIAWHKEWACSWLGLLSRRLRNLSICCLAI